jgi:hypothetical protein
MHPQLYLGLIGFTTQQRERVHAFLESHARYAAKSPADISTTNTTVADPSLAPPPAVQSQNNIEYPIWQLVDYQHADGLFISSQAVELAQDHTLYFRRPTTPDQQPLAVDLETLSVPCALEGRQRLIDEGLLLAANFPAVDADDSASLLQALRRFESLQLPLRSMYALAAEIIARRQEMEEGHTYHLEDRGKLHALLDVPQRRAMLRPGVRPVDLVSNQWSMRPKSANFAPSDFVACSFDEIAWVYAMHSPQVLLPGRYTRKRIFLRRMPRVRPSMLYERLTPLFEALHQQPMEVAELYTFPGVDSGFLLRDLFALYLCRSITTTPSKLASSLLADDALMPNVQPSEIYGASALERLGRTVQTMNATLE